MPDVPSHRICSKCNLDKPADAFRIDKRFGILEARCKACGNAYTKQVRETEQGKIINRRCSRNYAQKYPERVQENRRKIRIDPLKRPSHKQCSHCNEIKPADRFYIDNRVNDGLTAECADCKAIYRKQYRRTEHGRALTSWLANRQYYKEDRDTLRARDAIRKALYRKKLQPPDACSQCGKTNTRIEAHHHKGYAYEHRFDVVWLCSLCHNRADQERRANEQVGP